MHKVQLGIEIGDLGDQPFQINILAKMQDLLKYTYYMALIPNSFGSKFNVYGNSGISSEFGHLKVADS